MSAFQVGPEHLGALIRWYLLDTRTHNHPRWRGCQPNLNDAADMLAALAFECYKSVRYRYPDGDLPGPCAFPDTPVVCSDNLHTYRPLTPIEVIVACKCYEYQSCEHPEWGQSEAAQLIQHIKEAALRRLPGYEDAPWEITESYKEYTDRKRAELRGHNGREMRA